MSKREFSHRVRVDQDATPEEVLCEEYVEKVCPNLAAFLTEQVESKGRDKKNTLTVFYDLGKWKFSLSDKEADLKTFSSLDTLEDFLEAVEAHFIDPEVKWRKERTWARQDRG